MTKLRQPCSVPQIRIWKVSEDQNGALDVWLPADCPFGNLQLKLAKIVLGADEANRKVASTFEQWQCSLGSASLSASSRHRLHLESAMFLMRRVADELVSVHAVLGHLETHGRYPDRIGIDCVGTLLKHGSALSSPPFRDHQETLRTLNDIDHAHKHIFADANPALAGGHEPAIAALALRRGGLSFGPRFFRVPLHSLVEDFDRFYSDCLVWLCGWSERHLRKAAA